MGVRRVRMADVAEAAGVSPTTVSFVLNDRDASISDETRTRVITIARTMGYRPHAVARALASGRTHRIGIVLNQPESFTWGDTYCNEVLAGIVRSALKHDHNLLLQTAHYADVQTLCSDILSSAVDGVLLVGRYSHDELTPLLLDAGFPTVCLSYRVEHPECYSVDCDNEEGGALAMQHLLSLGHRRIALLYPGEAASWGQERRQGALSELLCAGLPAQNLLVYPWREDGPQTGEWARATAERLKAENPRPTAVICCDEYHARMLVEILPEVGLRVPEDCAVISFNSTEMSRRTRPPMTSIRQSLTAVGETGMEMLVRLIQKEPVESRHCSLPVRLDVRRSCGAGVKTRNPAKYHPSE